MADKNLYERLGGVFAIAGVVDQFSDAVVSNPIVGKASKNPALRQWHTKNLGRLPGLKFMRTLWTAELGRTLDFAKVPKREKEEVLAAFAAHKSEVTAGYMAAAAAKASDAA